MTKGMGAAVAGTTLAMSPLEGPVPPFETEVKMGLFVAPLGPHPPSRAPPSSLPIPSCFFPPFDLLPSILTFRLFHSLISIWPQPRAH